MVAVPFFFFAIRIGHAGPIRQIAPGAQKKKNTHPKEKRPSAGAQGPKKESKKQLILYKQRKMW